MRSLTRVWALAIGLSLPMLAWAQTPPVMMPMTAVFVGNDLDKVGLPDSLVPDGQPDHHFQISGLKSTPIVKRRITMTNGPYVAETPYNGSNWNFLAVSNPTAVGTEDWWSSVWSGEAATAPVWHVQVFYADGTMAEMDVTVPTPVATCPQVSFQLNLAAYRVYLGTTPTEKGTPVATLPVTPTPVVLWTCPASLANGQYYLRVTFVGTNGAEGPQTVATPFLVGPAPAAIAIDSTVFVSTVLGQALNVRQTPGGTIVGTQVRGTQGTVIAGPTVIAGVTWWQIAYATGLTGWSSGAYLSLTAP